MFLDLSTTNILLIVGVVALFILFIIVLMKLNPSKETKENPESDVKNIEDAATEKPKPSQTEQSEPKSMPQIGSETKESVLVVPAAVEKTEITEKTPMIAEKPSIVVEKPPVTANATVRRLSTLASQEKKAPIPIRDKKAISKPEKTVAPEIENTSSSKKDCPHRFGYLRTLPKKAPIPDECFGCSKLVQCRTRAKT
jgi:type IV secretory pathway VirB10-like protein